MKNILVTLMISDYSMDYAIPIKKDKGITVRLNENRLYEIRNGKKIISLIPDYQIGKVVELDYETETFKNLHVSEQYKSIFGGCDFLTCKDNTLKDTHFSSVGGRNIHKFSKG